MSKITRGPHLLDVVSRIPTSASILSVTQDAGGFFVVEWMLTGKKYALLCNGVLNFKHWLAMFPVEEQPHVKWVGTVDAAKEIDNSYRLIICNTFHSLPSAGEIIQILKGVGHEIG